MSSDHLAPLRRAFWLMPLSPVRTLSELRPLWHGSSWTLPHWDECACLLCSWVVWLIPLDILRMLSFTDWNHLCHQEVLPTSLSTSLPTAYSLSGCRCQRLLCGAGRDQGPAARVDVQWLIQTKQGGSQQHTCTLRFHVTEVAAIKKKMPFLNSWKYLYPFSALYFHKEIIHIET